MKTYRVIPLLSLVFSLSLETHALAAKKDFKGLFGSYRRERFVENEGKSTNIGVDVNLSTLFPVSPVVKSSENVNGSNANMNYSLFYNVEASAWATIAYNFAVYLSVAHYSYDTRKENQVTNPTLPLFHQFEMQAIPAMLGLRYRLSREDIVPYIGVGVGMAYVHRRSSYDYEPTGRLTTDEYKTVACGHGSLGMEFFFASNAGLRLELSAFYLNLPARTADTLGNPSANPVFLYQPNVWSVRYSSGIFLLF